MTNSEVSEAALAILRMLPDYSNPPTAERTLDPVFYAYFQGRFGSMSRQMHVRLHGRRHPRRIDYRFGTTNPVVIELAVRSPQRRGDLRGPKNTTELRKLTRVTQASARRRILLLVDLAPEPIARDRLKATYDPIHAGRGNFRRHSVRVIYVHVDLQYHFPWRPKTG